MIIRVGIFLTSLFIGCWLSTLLLLSKVPSANLPGEGYFSIFGVKIYFPWMWVKWHYLYGNHFHLIFLKTIWPIQVSILTGVFLALTSRFITNSKSQKTSHGSARWASESDIIKANLNSEEGVVLGQSKETGKVLRHAGPEHVLVIAPTRTGKGVGLVVPTLLSFGESAIIFDPKGENWQISSGYRASIGQCFCFDPTSPNSARFNPLMEIRKGALEIKDAQNIADIIVDPDGRIDSRNHWQNAAHSLLVGTIIFVIYEWPKKSLAGVVEFLTQPNKTFEQALELMGSSEHLIVKSVAQEMLNKHIEERSGVLSTAVSLLSIFRDPLVANCTDAHDFSVISLKNSEVPISLYLVLPPSDISRLRVLFRIILNQIGRVLTEKHENVNTYNRKILFLLDEFPSLGRLEFFESALAYMAGYGLKAFLICQSLNQLQKAYGERNSILDNCHVRIAFANNDDQTAKRLSNLLGDETATKEQVSLSGSRFDMFFRNTSVSQVDYGRPLLMPAEINRLPADQEIILVNGVLPILAKKIIYFTDNRFKNRLYPPICLASRDLPDLRSKSQVPQKYENSSPIGSAL